MEGNTLNDLSNKVCVPNEGEVSNIHLSNMITGIDESKMLTKYISWECNCKFGGRKCNSNQKWSNDKYQYECKKTYLWKRLYLESCYM